MSTFAPHSPINISETVRDLTSVHVPKRAINIKMGMACGKSNGYVTDDVT